VEIEGVPRITDEGKYLVIFEKQPDGTWLMSTINYSRNTAKPTVEDE
jgi:ketosteroid isomerase-like protein